jgi:DNA uptake protein ComE-like DNA-binding protein
MRNIVLLLALVLLVLTAALAQGQKAKDEVWVELLPPGEGRQPVLSTCLSCHNLKVVVQARKSRADWAKSLNDMIQRGAPVFPEEIEPITAYLSKAFGADVPQLVNVNTASREELEKVRNLKPETVARILEARSKAGPFKSSEGLRRALGMEKPDFEKIVYLFKYSD